MALALGEALHHEHARQPELAARELPGAGRRRPRRTSRARCRELSSSPVSASITGIDPVRIAPAPSTTPLPTRAPSATMQREPIIVSSPMITGAACGGSSTPPMPTPPERCTRSPICAHEPDRRPRVDHRVGADAGADVHVARHHHHAGREVRAPPRRRAGNDPHAAALVVALQRDLVVVLERAELGASPCARAGTAAAPRTSATRARRPRRRRARPPAPRRCRAARSRRAPRCAASTSGITAARSSRPSQSAVIVVLELVHRHTHLDWLLAVVGSPSQARGRGRRPDEPSLETFTRERELVVGQGERDAHVIEARCAVEVARRDQQAGGGEIGGDLPSRRAGPIGVAEPQVEASTARRRARGRALPARAARPRAGAA